MFRSLKLFSRLRFRPLSTNAPQLPALTEPIEEETLRWYTPTRFYSSLKTGDILRSRYQVLAKLGYGSCSTAWLCRDLSEMKYVAVKVCISNYPSIERERAAYRHLRDVCTPQTQNTGCELVRIAADEFELSGAEGPHRCFVFKPLGLDLIHTREILGDLFNEAVFKTIAVHVLRSIDFLHTRARMAHGDIRAENFFLSTFDDSACCALEEMERSRPSCKVDGERIIYKSHGQIGPEDLTKLGVPILCDFGEAQFGKDNYSIEIQPIRYRAPEVVFAMPWNNSAEIWNVGLMLWQLFQREPLLTAADADGQPSEIHLVAEMIALIGPPPKSFVGRIPPKVREGAIDDDGKWLLHASIPIPDISFEGSELALSSSGNDNSNFLRFIKRMLQWDPESRPTAAELLRDPWLKEVTASPYLLSAVNGR